MTDESPATTAPAAPEPTKIEVRPETIEIATLEGMLAKPARKDEVTIPGVGKIKMLALSHHAYDQLVAKYPPTREGRDHGDVYNPDTFGPALLEAVITEPKLTAEQWKQVWNSPQWAPGEVGALFNAAWRLCQGGLDIPFSVSG